MRDAGKLLDIADKAIRHIDCRRGEVADEKHEIVARLGSPVALYDKRLFFLGEAPGSSKRRLLQDAKTQIAVADGAADIEPVAILGSVPQYGVAVWHHAKRGNGDAQGARRGARIAADESGACAFLEILKPRGECLEPGWRRPWRKRK